MSIASASRFPAGTWLAEPRHSHVGFSVGHASLGTFRGSFASHRVRLVVGHDGDASLTGTVDAASVISRDPDLDALLKSAELLDVDRFPELRFASTSIQRDAHCVELDGTLTIKDRTLLVAGNGGIVDLSGTRLDLELTTVLDRRQFGLEWNLRLPSGVVAIGNEVTIETRLVLLKHSSESH